jgi:glutamine kinase
MNSDAVHAFILGSKRGRRRLDIARSSPPSLDNVSGGETALDWLLHALNSSSVRDVTFVGGYHIEKVISRFPSLSYRFVTDWATKHERDIVLATLSDDTTSDILLARGDLVALPAAIERVLQAPGPIVQTVMGPGSQAAGLMLIRRRAVPALQTYLSSDLAGSRGALSSLLSGVPGAVVETIDISEFAARTDDRVALQKLVFAGKAQTLEQIRPLLTEAVVLDLVRFTVERWSKDKAGCLEHIRAGLAAERLIVRSSTIAEDGLVRSNAGYFLSVADIPRLDDLALEAAIDRVIESYGRAGRKIDPADEVLVQPYISGLAFSGVLLTRDLDNAAPYFVLNVDTATGRADSVTSGAEIAVDTFFGSWNCDLEKADETVRRPIRLARELMHLTSLDSLDIEFAMSSDDRLFLLQVRPFAASRQLELADEDLLDTLTEARKFVSDYAGHGPDLLGAGILLSTMTDWNPAEMIGAAPTALSLSLYQSLIGDTSWAAARAAIGYRDVRPTSLILSIGGVPYVDVRASLNSFLPATLSDEIGEIWVNDCLARLRADPTLHDKVEFNVTLTCLDADVASADRRLASAGLTASQRGAFIDALRDITRRAVLGIDGSIGSHLNAVMSMERGRRRAIATCSTNAAQSFAAARRLIDNCRTFGAEPFAILARYAFVALALLKSLRNVDALDDDDLEMFMRGVPTVAGEFTRDIQAYGSGRISRDVLIERYGHLRPSTYEITASRYDADPDSYFAAGRAGGGGFATLGDPAKVLEKSGAKVDAALRNAGFDFDHRQLGSFAIAAISSRERAKFEFTKNLSLALEKIADGGSALGLSRETLAHLPAELILRLATDTAGSASTANLRRVAAFNQKRWGITKVIRMPDVISADADTMLFRHPEGQPNFVTRHCVTAPSLLIDGPPGESLDGRIVLIRSADPGFDWIFAHRLVGLITEFGGVASHMAIRAMEFGIPAAIGCGPSLFGRLAKADLITLDCDGRKVVPASK